jgi:hypothetical protein
MAMVNSPRSKARPARLVYPKRNREEDPARLFVAVLKIDADGYVVGAKLEQQPPGVAADRAMSAVWRFSYDPALDDAGKPIASTVEQHFMVELIDRGQRRRD